MATWTTLDDLSTGDLVTEENMDNLRGNIEYLLDPNRDSSLEANAGTSTSSTSFVDIDSTNLSVAVTTNGGPLLLGFNGLQYTGSAYYDFSVDGTRIGDTTVGTLATNGNGAVDNITMIALAEVDAGAHTITVQWRVSSSSASLLSSIPASIFAIEV